MCGYLTKNLIIMKNLYIPTLLFFSSFLFSQDYINNDSIFVNNQKLETTHISYGNTSLVKNFKIISCESNDYEKIKEKIIEYCYQMKKEYSEIYIISIPKISKLSTKELDNIHNSFINKIDNERMNMNLSTALIKFKYDFKIDKFTYFLEEPKREISELKNFYSNIKVNQLRKVLF